MTDANTAPQANTEAPKAAAPTPAPKPAVAPAAPQAAAAPKAAGVVHDRDFHVRNMDKASHNRNPDGTLKVVYPIIQKDGKA